MIAAKIRTLVKQLDSSYILNAEPVELTRGLDTSVKENSEGPEVYPESTRKPLKPLPKVREHVGAQLGPRMRIGSK